MSAYLFILQTKYQFLDIPDTQSIWIFVVIIVVVVALLIIAPLLRNRSSRTATRRKHSRYLFRQMARSTGLQKQHISALETLIKTHKIREPYLIFSSSKVLDNVLQRGLNSVENDESPTDQEKEGQALLYFQIKQLIERNSRSKIGITSSNFLEPGQVLVLIPASGGRYPSKLLSNMHDSLACSVAKDKSQREIRWDEGVKLKASFWREHDAGYSFFSKVLGYETIKGTECLLIQHSKSLKRDQQRKFRRRPLENHCYFYPISIREVGTGRKKSKKAVIEKKKMIGTVRNLSAGGCSIQTRNSPPIGTLLKIEFELEEKGLISIFGKVKRLRQESPRSKTMHIMYTKVSGNYLNRIYSFVYNFPSY